MHINDRNRAKLILAAGLIGMAAQEALSMMPGNILKSAALLILALSVGLLLFANSAAFRAGFEEARRDTQAHGVGSALRVGYEDGSRTK